MHFGWCYYDLKVPLIYGLYIQKEFRRKGYSRKLLNLVIDEIRSHGIPDDIKIEVMPLENSISSDDLKKYYESLGLEILLPKQLKKFKRISHVRMWRPYEIEQFISF